jgi:transcription elongation factor Elf1
MTLKGDLSKKSEFTFNCADCGRTVTAKMTKAEWNDHTGNLICYSCLEKREEVAV